MPEVDYRVILSVGGRLNFKMGLLGIRVGVWIDLAGDGDRRWTLFNTKLRGSIQRGEFLDELKIYRFLNTMLHTVDLLVTLVI
jgi:hypothetical protein